MRAFPPIAIVGRGCVLPGALDPAALWALARDGRNALARAPEGHWRLDAARILAVAGKRGGEMAVSDAGGYVAGFDRHYDMDATAAILPDAARLDPLVHWLIHCGRAALVEAGTRVPAARAGLISGNLSYPSAGAAAFVEEVWLDGCGAEPRNRFSSGLPVHLAARVLGLSGVSFALDAACASSLYAIKLACDRLHDGEADLMLAGGVNRADDLFLHLGFTALQALSPSGQSRPFHADADGLVPAEGAALVALMRLEDARAANARVLGVIRGIGLSNDGRQSGFLAPSAKGQARAMAAAFAQSGLTPQDIAYVECHATGTARGDAIELDSVAAAYGAARPALGSLKANLGHSITASGAASLIKILGAFEARVLPPAPCDKPNARVAAHGFSLLPRAEAWTSDSPMRAAISNFGFGGNNAHLLVESYEAKSSAPAKRAPQAPKGALAICGIGAVTGGGAGLHAFARTLFGPEAADPAARIETISLPLQGLAFPPSDLKAALGQQTAMLKAANEAIASVKNAAAERSGIFIGMGCDATIGRHGLRARAPELLAARGRADDAAPFVAANELTAPVLTAAGVIGTMPNIPANRIHAQHDWRGPGFTISSEELSGLDALAVAARMLRASELDMALVGASELAQERAHVSAASALFPGDRKAAGDGAIALILKRLDDAQRDGDPVYAVLDDEPDDAAETLTLDPDAGVSPVTARFGHAHAASGLLHVAAAALYLHAGARVDAVGAWPAVRASGARIAVHVKSFDGTARTVMFARASGVKPSLFACADAPLVATFAANTRAELARAVERDAQGGAGEMRLALVAEDAQALLDLKTRALSALAKGSTPGGPGIFFGEGADSGDIAFTFTGAAAAYPGAGRDMLLAWPELQDKLAARHEGAPRLARRFYGLDVDALDPPAQLTGCALVCQAHALLTREVLRLTPQAAVGLSSGETNALLAFGVWRDLDAMLDEIARSGLYGEALTGPCNAAAEYWGVAPGSFVWKNYRIAAPVDDVRAAIGADPRVFITIIHADNDCIIGGEAQACQRVIAAAGKSRAIDLGLDMVVHCAPFAPFAETWRAIHSREVHPAPGVRFYSNAHNRAYVPTREAAADAITDQALHPIDFPKTVAQAAADGARIFVEHGPRGILTSAIDRILADQPHVAVALDRKARPGLSGLGEAVAALWAAGVAFDIGAVQARFQAIRAARAPEDVSARMLTMPAHPPDVAMPAPRAAQPHVAIPIPHAPAMPQAPALPPVIHLGEAALAPSPVVATMPVSANDAADMPAFALIAAIGATHRAFLTQQASVHAAFLAFRRPGAPSAPTAIQVAPRAVPQALEPVPPSSASPAPAPDPARPLYTRAQLEILAGGRISDVFGPQFAEQDGYARQVRMPEPPLLLADRVMLIEGEPRSMGRGRIVTETDVAADAWYLHAGRMCPGVVIESGQADLLLISWLGADFLNKGERVYRLLGCELTFFGGLPAPGETLRYDIHVDGHAKGGDVRLFFFHYDCYAGARKLLTVRNGQAGFFTEEELAESGGVLWEAADDAPKAAARLDTPPCVTAKRAFTADEVRAFAAGDAFACFGAGFEMAAAHQRTPSIPSGRLQMIESVATFDPKGGPWERGYLRARAQVDPDAWFFKGHFKNDPCMPGTLMADAATQALAFAMAALGFTIARDGWRFEPATESCAKFLCRGQVIPDAPHRLDYEVFIEEIIDGPEPTVYAALLCRSDGFKVFQCRRFGLKLAPDWPLTTRPQALTHAPLRIVGQSQDVRGDHDALIACAWGKPSMAFGGLYTPFDSHRRAPRLPGPPYHFVSRIERVDGAPGTAAKGGAVVASYDVPRDAWYFGDQLDAIMPFAALTEVLLQPCGWLASYMGFAANRPDDVAFRNLDGDDAILHRPVTRASGMLTTTATLDHFAQAAGTTVVAFTVTCADARGPVMTLKTKFGFFSPHALTAQVGLPADDAARSRIAALPDAPLVKPTEPHRPEMLRLIDWVAHFDPAGGAAGEGGIAGVQRVDPTAWYFKAHFFQDPVQPGSLGLEALIELLEAFVSLRGAARGIPAPRIVAPAPGATLRWRFRGQVLPTTKRVVSELEITDVAHADGAVTVTASGSLWADGVRIYEVKGLSLRVEPGPA